MLSTVKQCPRDPCSHGRPSYSANIGRIIAEHQITNGGPVILYQPENEYQSFVDEYDAPDYEYWDNVKKQFEDAGIVVPSINNEAHMNGYITTLTPANVDIYGHDSYPVGFDCTRPDIWPTPLATDWLAENNQLAPESPYALLEVCCLTMVAHSFLSQQR